MRAVSVCGRFRYFLKFALVAVALAWNFSLTGCGGSGSQSSTPPPPTLSIASATLSDGIVGAAYSQTVQATGGVAPFSWSVGTGSLPHGLNLASSSSNAATISGTPDTVQTAVSFTIRVTDSAGQSASQSYSVNIKVPLLSITSATLSDGTVGAAYNQTVQATGGIGPFNWSVNTGSLPQGLTLASSSSNTATISGTPTAVQTGVTFTIGVTDSASQSASQSYSVNIKDPLLSITSATLSDGTVGAAYSQAVLATGGIGPFNWSVTTGSLPPDLTLVPSSSNTATISGTPTMAQTGVTFTIGVTDSAGQSATQQNTVNIKGTLAQTQSGPVQGLVQNNELVFRGIPYAAPPVGNLRWKPPQTPIAWTGTTRDAFSFGNECPQLDSNSNFMGAEDCLFLNIFIPSQTAHGQPVPVMVFFHGGSNVQGSTTAPMFDTPPLANQGVIVVTVQYRLGLLGFFVSPLLDAEGGSSGNYGLMDQIAALTWVQKNITAFGGDPTHVMVFGHSSGAYDIQALLYSPLAKGLFSAAGMESGSFVHGQILSLPALESLESQQLISALSCSTASDKLACLRAALASDIVNNQSSIPNLPSSLQSRTLAIEPRVLPTDPYDALQTNGSPVPLLIGSTREEASGSSPTDDPNTTPPLTEAQYESALQTEFGSFGPSVPSQVLSFYPAMNYANEPVYALIAVDSDFHEICEDRNVARAAVHPSGPPVFRYLYIHRYETDPTLNALRAFHGSEVPFVFGSPQLINGGPYTPSAAELTFAGQMMGYWSRFAQTGNPNGSGATSWPTYDATTDAMLQLDETQITINGYDNPGCNYLETLLP